MMAASTENMDRTLYVLSGMTAVGKTSLALRWAEANTAEILSCDSLLCYRGMDSGTAQPDALERNRVPQHGIDLVEVEEQYNVDRYVAYARAVIEDIHRRGFRVLITGGSGFYLKSFFAAVTDQALVSAEIRERVAHLYERGGNEAVLAALEAVEGNDLSLIDTQNPRRTVAALERCWGSGLTLQAQRARFEALKSPFADYPKQTCILTREREVMFERIEARVRQMLNAGLIDEVSKLRSAGLERNPSAARSIGYREVLTWLDAKEGGLEALTEAIVVNTRRLARRQRTWLRHQISVDQWLDLDSVEESDAVDQLFAADSKSLG